MTVLAMSSQQPILLVFTLGPEREAFRRQLLPRPLARLERSLWSTGLEEAIAAGREAGCRVVVSSPDPLHLPAGVAHSAQREGTFAARLAAAMAEVQSEGPLVVVGTDVPGLGPQHIRAALAQLQGTHRRVVVGPSPDGGIYLLAASLPLATLMEGVAWCTATTRRSLLDVLGGAGLEAVHLPALADLDRRRDLARLLAAPRAALTASWRALARLVVALVAELCRPRIPNSLGRALTSLHFAPAGRAPPRTSA